MKIITLVPVKNEAWILPYSLKNYTSFSDHIIVADQQSTDETRLICSQFEKVTLISNPYSGHTNQVRWLLLDEARKIPGNNLIVYLDADELISPNWVKEVEQYKRINGVAGFCSPWIQLYGSLTTHRIDGVWKKNTKQFAFFDDRKIDYDRTLVTNDHSNRIPSIKNITQLKTPILHLQYLAKARCEIKQVLYMCTELIQGKNPRKINNQFSVAKLSNSIEKTDIEPDWWDGIIKPPLNIFEIADVIKEKQVFDLLDKYGPLFFEPLDIWHIEMLEQYFQVKEKRVPKIKKFPKIIVTLNNLKNSVKNAILKQ